MIRLVKTCSRMPEQYDAYIGEESVGYLRLRHGYFSVECPGPCDDLVYEASPVGHGEFEDDERDLHLSKAKEAIMAWVERRKK